MVTVNMILIYYVKKKIIDNYACLLLGIHDIGSFRNDLLQCVSYVNHSSIYETLD